MNFTTHNDNKIDVGGTFLQGYITAGYRDLLAKFGPHLSGDGYKVDAEWNLLFDDGTVASIYNWKNGPSYLGNTARLGAIDEWNIGGSSSRAVEMVKEVLAS